MHIESYTIQGLLVHYVSPKGMAVTVYGHDVLFTQMSIQSSYGAAAATQKCMEVGKYIGE